MQAPGTAPATAPFLIGFPDAICGDVSSGEKPNDHQRQWKADTQRPAGDQRNRQKQTQSSPQKHAAAPSSSLCEELGQLSVIRVSIPPFSPGKGSSLIALGTAHPDKFKVRSLVV